MTKMHFARSSSTTKSAAPIIADVKIQVDQDEEFKLTPANERKLPSTH